MSLNRFLKCSRNYPVYLKRVNLHSQVLCSHASTCIWVVPYDNSGHGNDDGKVHVNYVATADNKIPQQMTFHGVVCCLHSCH